jgi:hypothetical protein
MIRQQQEESPADGYHPDHLMLAHNDPDEELIFDLEL